MISSLLHLVGLRPRVYYTLTNFRGGGQAPQYANGTFSGGVEIFSTGVVKFSRGLRNFQGGCEIFRGCF